MAWIADLIEWLAIFSMSLMGVELTRTDGCSEGGTDFSVIGNTREIVEFIPGDRIAYVFDDCNTGATEDIRYETVNAALTTVYKS
ncbi:hypothetical protein [Maricaulis sp. MIT060901]|uniref:hypothetical protein n=1 Tax=Maricaulis sp. MIT060901 TaxID=3096993 RepID=UPI00399A62C3